MNKFTAGQRVVFNGGFPGAFVRDYSDGMIEVRGASGLVCIPEGDAMDMRGCDFAQHLLALHRGDVERAARWMRDGLRIGGIKECRGLLVQAQRQFPAQQVAA